MRCFVINGHRLRRSRRAGAKTSFFGAFTSVLILSMTASPVNSGNGIIKICNTGTLPAFLAVLYSYSGGWNRSYHISGWWDLHKGCYESVVGWGESEIYALASADSNGNLIPALGRIKGAERAMDVSSFCVPVTKGGPGPFEVREHHPDLSCRKDEVRVSASSGLKGGTINGPDQWRRIDVDIANLTRLAPPVNWARIHHELYGKMIEPGIFEYDIEMARREKERLEQERKQKKEQEAARTEYYDQKFKNLQKLLDDPNALERVLNQSREE